jgi:hypothetical protein
MSGTQLIEAVRNSDSAAAAKLIRSGADVDQQDDNQWTPLCWAAGKGDIDTVRMLVNSGADVLKAGIDQRTPYLIALAAGRKEVASFLRDAEENATGRPKPKSRRQYCRACSLETLRKFPGWPEAKDVSSRKANGSLVESSDKLSDDDYLYIHQDLTVTRSIWHTEDVIFDKVTSEWEEFCSSVLRFSVPDDLDLIPTPVASQN